MNDFEAPETPETPDQKIARLQSVVDRAIEALGPSGDFVFLAYKLGKATADLPVPNGAEINLDMFSIIQKLSAHSAASRILAEGKSS